MDGDDESVLYFPEGAGPMIEATRRLWDGNTAKHSESFCRLFPCLSQRYQEFRGYIVVVKGLDVVKGGQNGALKRRLYGQVVRKRY